ncbi:MAG: hypothetical protein WD794_02030 [Mycobacteriales bacterium]
MNVVDVDSLAVLPVTASASAGFARGVDFSRGRDERQEQLRPLTTALASGEPTTVVFRDAIDPEQLLLPSHAASALRHITCLAVVSAPRPAQAVLGEVAGQSCMISQQVHVLVPGRPCGG